MPVGRRKKKGKELATLTIALCRCHWLERNNYNFERQQATEETIICRIKEEY
jgi:hypothetical protein